MVKMSKESPEQETSHKQVDLYHSVSDKPSVQYRVVKLPLQDYVSIVRKAVCQGWSQVRGTIRSSVSTVRTKAHDQLKSVGVKDPTTVMQASAVGTAALVGLFMARHKSMFRRVLYPLAAGTGMCGVIVLSSPTKREEVFGTIRKEVSENFQREFSKHMRKELPKHFPKEYAQHLPEDLKEEFDKLQREQNESEKTQIDTSAAEKSENSEAKR